MEKINSFKTYENLPVKNLKIAFKKPMAAITKSRIGDKYQRGVTTNKVLEISKNFDEDLLGTITVSLRDGNFYILDGDHRIYEARKNGIKMLWCLVYHNLTFKEEARIFRGLNNTTKLTPYDNYNASIAEEDETSLNIKYITEKNRMEISNSGAKDKIKSITTLYTIYNKYGAAHLYKTLMFIKATWDGESKSLNSNSIRGMSEFLHIYGNDISLDIFAKKLGKYDPLKIAREADNDTNPVSKVAKTVNVIFKYYNLKLSSNRLTNKHRRAE